MAKSKSAKKVSERPFHGFVRCELDADQKKHAKEWIATQKPGWDAMVELVDRDYKISFSYDNYHATYQCSITAGRPSDVNYGWVLVGRAPSTDDAFGMALYKHYMVLREVWSEGGVDKSEDDGWG